MQHKSAPLAATIPNRQDVEFLSADDICRAWLYESVQERQAPCVVMASGYGGTRECGLDPYARVFAEAGFNVLVFDYRFFGASDGEPRQLFSVEKQLEDWASAIAFARGLDSVDKKRIALWGTSFSGGHVVVAAARDKKIAAISAQCPMMDARASGRANFKSSGFFAFSMLGFLSMVDNVKSLFGGKPVYIPLVGKPGSVAAMTSPDTLEGYGAITPPGWVNKVTTRHILTLLRYRPINYARKLKCPALVQVCMDDQLAPADAAIKLAEKLKSRAQLESYNCGHFDIYRGRHFDRASAEQLEFFQKHLRN